MTSASTGRAERPNRETRIVKGEEEVVKLIGPFLSRAAMASPEPYAYGTSDPQSIARASEGAYYEASRKLLSQNAAFRIRNITDIQRENLEAVKRLLEIGYEMRHIDGNTIRFSVSRDEYIEVIRSKSPGGTADEIVWSNDPQLVAQATRIFDALWDIAVPSDIRIREIEGGAPQPTLRIMRNPHQIQTLYLDLVKQAKEEILLKVPTANAFHGQVRIGIFEALQAAASERGVKVRIVSPNSTVQESLEALSNAVRVKVGAEMIEHRRILEDKTPIPVTILVVDRSASLVIELNDDSQLDFDKANGAATCSTRNPTVTANVRFFERLWEDVELRERERVLLEKEKRSRRTAELLQDILSHDIRNYNQASMIDAELLGTSLAGNVKVLSEATTLVDAIIRQTSESSELNRMAQKLRMDLSVNLKVLNDAGTLIDGVIRATDGSSNLIDRAKKLGKIISQEGAQLHPVDLESSIRKSMDLVVNAHPNRSINPSFTVAPGARVLADEMLEEVFTNLLSNSVNYTERDEVPVEIVVEGGTLEGKPGTFWKITFTDHGKGIPDDMKENVFTRYLNSARGTGLGMSIVYALAVERYAGKVRVSNRVQGDYTKGTQIEIWLPRAS